MRGGSPLPDNVPMALRMILIQPDINSQPELRPALVYPQQQLELRVTSFELATICKTWSLALRAPDLRCGMQCGGSLKFGPMYFLSGSWP